MTRYAALAFGSMLLASAVEAASVSGPPARHALVQRSGGWMAPDAKPKHAWLYASGNSSNNVVIIDLEKVGTPTVERQHKG